MDAALGRQGEQVEIGNNVTRRRLLRSVLGTAVFASTAENGLGQRVSKPPNMLFIMADDLGYADV